MFALRALATTVVMMLMAAVPATAATSAEIVRALNAERAADGIPALHEDPALSSACDAHNAYLEANPDTTNPHTEDPNAPGYTPAGAAVAAISDIALGDNFDQANPFAHAPFHLMRELDPALQLTGAADSHGNECVAVADSRRRTGHGPSRFYTSPANGRGGVAGGDYEWEAPYWPGSLFGIGPFTPLGPHLYLFRFPERTLLTIRRAWLTGPGGGRIAVRIVDGRYAAVPTSSALLFPDHPVPAGVYCAHIERKTDTGLVLRYRWWFATEGAPAIAPKGCGPPPPARLHVRSVRVSHGKVTAIVTQDARARGKLTVLENRGIASFRLNKTRTTVSHGIRRITYSGPLADELFIWVQVMATLRRTDGGSDATTYRNRRVG
jgi:hypothetical protein